MTYLEIVKELKKNGVESSEWDAQVLMESSLGISTSQVLLNKTKDYNSKELLEAVARRCQREPLQYIVGAWPFYHQEYYVSKDCLIPRQDTETLVEYAIQCLPSNARFIDLCTGSGCIAISLACERKDVNGLAMDLSEKALEIAKKNAFRNHVEDRVSFLHGDVLKYQTEEQFDAILSNPPYIQSSVIPTLSCEVKQEPLMALDGGIDGLDFYRNMIPLWKKNLNKNGMFIFEIGYDQGDAVLQMGKDNEMEGWILKDLSNNDRVAILKRKGEE